MRHRGAERGLARRAFGIDMDELVVLDYVGIHVDPLLIDDMPGGYADFRTHHRQIGGKRDRRLLPDLVHGQLSTDPAERTVCSSGNSSSRNSRPRKASLRSLSCSSRRNCTRRIFPEIVFGSSVTSSMRRMRLNGASLACRWRKIDSAVSGESGLPATSNT